MSRYQRSTTWSSVVLGLGAGYLLAILAMLIGWVINVFQIINMTDVFGTGLGIARVVGLVIAPLGGILGLFVW